MKPSLHLVILVVLLLIVTIGLISFRPIKPNPAYASNSASLNYTALGDSITAGTSSGSYVDKYKNYINTDLGVPVTAMNLGIGGLTSGKLLDKLKNDQTFRNSVKSANLVTVFIGFNNFAIASTLYDQGKCGGPNNQDCLSTIANNFKDHLTNIISEIKSINQNQNTIILLSDLYNPYINKYINNGTTGIFVPFMGQLNNSIHSIGTSNGLNVTNVYQAFNGTCGFEDPITKGYIYDSVHPSGQGHEVIATKFRNFNNVLLTRDTDGDTFSNSLEKYLGTDPLASCPTGSSHSAFPPDFDNSAKVEISDIVAVVGAYYKDTSSPDWAAKYKKFDLDSDGKITISDISLVQSYYYKSYC